MGRRKPLESQTPMRLLEAPAVADVPTREPRRLHSGYLGWWHVTEQLLRKLQNLGRVYLPAGREYKPRWGELPLQPVAAIFTGRCSHRLFVPQDRPPQCLAGERCLEQMIVHQVLGRIDALTELRKNDLLLAFEMFV